jgi:hypothetical protein
MARRMTSPGQPRLIESSTAADRPVTHRRFNIACSVGHTAGASPEHESSIERGRDPGRRGLGERGSLQHFSPCAVRSIDRL